MSPAPMISVAMPVYNAGDYLPEAISSILEQTCADFEFIIAVDESSADCSARIVRDFAARDSRVKPIFMPRCSQAKALNTAMKAARGGWIAFMEADDVALPGRLAIQLDFIRKTGADICGGLGKRFGRDSRVLWFPEKHEAIRFEMLFRCAFLMSTAFMRAEIARANPFDENAVFLDYEMWTRLIHTRRMANLQQVLLKRRIHPRQTTAVKTGRINDELRRFRREYFFRLFPRATSGDYAALERVAERKAFPDTAELALAGEWMAKLARVDDFFLRLRMAERWYYACSLSARLGRECFRVYRRFSPLFGLAEEPKTFYLPLACALRFSPDSALYASGRKFKSLLRSAIRPSGRT